MLNKIGFLSFGSVLAFALLACENADDNTLEKGRSCVDNAGKVALSSQANAAATAASMAQTCDTIISGYNGSNTRLANEVLFGAILIEEYKLTQIASMATSLKQSSNGLATTVSIMAFSSGVNGGASSATDLNFATRLLNTGNALGGGAQLIAGMISTATLVNSFAAINFNDPTSAKTDIANCAAACGTTCNCTAIASSIQSMQAGACASAADQNSTDPNNPCYISKQILNGASTPQQIVQNLSNYANTH